MKILIGDEALEWGRTNIHTLSMDHGLVYRKILLSRGITPGEETEEQGHTAEHEADRITCPINPIDEDDRQLAHKMIEVYGPELITVILESDRPDEDERIVMRTMLRVLIDNEEEQCIGAGSGPLEELTFTASKKDPETPYMDVTHIYNTCLRLVDKGKLQSMPEDMDDERNRRVPHGKYWFAVVQPITETLADTAKEMAEELALAFLKRLEDEID
jgi:hypothetical protein